MEVGRAEFYDFSRKLSAKGDEIFISHRATRGRSNVLAGGPMKSNPKISPAELRELSKRIKKRQDEYRRRYRAVHGKKLDFINHFVEENNLFISIRFLDGTNFCIRYEPTVELRGVDYSDMSSGDDVILKEYFKRCG